MIRPGGVSTVTVQSLTDFFHEFPGHQLLGWGQRAMGLDQVPPSFNGAGVKVAIIDSGAAQPTHRNLHRIGPGHSVVSNDLKAWTNDTIGHGSHCAGIIAGGPIGANSAGVRGFAPAAEVHVIQIFPGGKFSSLVQALDYCIENGIDVANLSLGGGEPSQIVEERLIKRLNKWALRALSREAIPVAVQFPASTPHVLAVSAIGKWGEFPRPVSTRRRRWTGSKARMVTSRRSSVASVLKFMSARPAWRSSPPCRTMVSAPGTARQWQRHM